MKIQSVYLYSDLQSKDMILEIWGASTKHPDCTFSYNNDLEGERYVQAFFAFMWDMENLYQWLCLCQSRLTFPSRDLHKLIEATMKLAFTHFG